MNKPYQVKITTSEGYAENIDLEDPFHHTTVVLGWNLWEALKMVFSRNREVEVKVNLTAHKIGAIQRVMTCLHEDCEGCGTGEDEIHGDHGPEKEQYVGGGANA